MKRYSFFAIILSVLFLVAPVHSASDPRHTKEVLVRKLFHSVVSKVAIKATISFISTYCRLAEKGIKDKDICIGGIGSESFTVFNPAILHDPEILRLVLDSVTIATCVSELRSNKTNRLVTNNLVTNNLVTNNLVKDKQNLIA